VCVLEGRDTHTTHTHTHTHTHTYMARLRALFSFIAYETLFSLGIRVKADLSPSIAGMFANFVYCGIESELTPIFVIAFSRCNRRGSATRKLQINSNS